MLAARLDPFRHALERGALPGAGRGAAAAGALTSRRGPASYVLSARRFDRSASVVLRPHIRFEDGPPGGHDPGGGLRRLAALAHGRGHPHVALSDGRCLGMPAGRRADEKNPCISVRGRE